MPRSFSNWNQHRRPGPSLFAVQAPAPASVSPGGDASGTGPSSSGGSQVDELETLIAGLFEDGGESPILPPYDDDNQSFLVPQGANQSGNPSCSFVLPRGFINTPSACSSAEGVAQSHGNGSASHSQAAQSTQLASQQPSGQAAPLAVPSQPAPLPPAEFQWSEVSTCLVTTDANGQPIDQVRHTQPRLHIHTHVGIPAAAA